MASPPAPPVGAGVPVHVYEGRHAHPVKQNKDAEDKFDDENFPAYSMGRAAEILGVTQAFLRSLDTANLVNPMRSEGGHRRYSRYQLRMAARARELVDQGTALDAACRIIILEDQLTEALRINEELRHGKPVSPDAPATQSDGGGGTPNTENDSPE